MATDDDQIDENPSPTAAGDETEIELAADKTGARSAAHRACRRPGLVSRG